MKTITEQFLSGIRWNTLEACLYQGILWGCHIALFSNLDRAAYGTIGILFSLLYIGVSLCSLGLDSALSPFIRYITHSKASFKGLLGVHCIPNLVLYGALLLLSCTYDLNNFFSLFGIAHLDQIFIFIFIMLLVTESIKKTVKTLLGLLFYNQMLATLEIIYIITYVTTIAALYYAHIPLTVYSIFLPVFIYSAVIAGILIATLFHYYNQLPETRDGIEPGLIKRMLSSRIFGYINQLGHIPFTGNMLVPLFAFHLGISQAAIAKVISATLQSISTIINKIIGQTSEAAFAHAHAYSSSSDEKHSIFALANRYVYSIMAYVFLILCAFNYKTIVAHAFIPDLHANTILIAFALLLVIEPLFMTYEKKYLVEEKGYSLLYYNLTMLLLFGAWIYSNCAYPLLCLLCLTSVRIAWYYALSKHYKTSHISHP